MRVHIAISSLVVGLAIVFMVGCTPVNKEVIIKGIIEQNYTGDTSKLVCSNDYKSMVDSLGDSYSEYLSPEEYNSLLSTNSGEYTGIGLQFYTDSGSDEAKIIRVYKDSPAEKAGLELGDTILNIKDNIHTEDGVSNIKVLRNGEEIVFKIPRDNIRINRVDAHLLGSHSNIGYIKIWEFEGNVYNQFNGAIKELKKRGADRLIIDVRDNPGGDLKSTLKIIDELVPEGKMLILHAKGNAMDNLSDYIESNKDFIPMAIAVLVNRNTASSAEILAGNLRYYRKSVLVGEKTYGKGTIQSIFPISDGSVVKLTVAEYSLPGGESINHTGLTPDIETDDSNRDKYDTALNVAVDLLERAG